MNPFIVAAFVFSGTPCYCAGTYVTAMTMNSIHVQEVMDCEDEQIAVPPNAAPGRSSARADQGRTVSLLTTILVLCAAYAAICAVLVFAAEWLFDFFTIKRGWIGSFREGGGMTYETRAQRFCRRIQRHRKGRIDMLKSIIIRWYRRMQLKALASEYDRMADRAERIDWPKTAQACREKAAHFRWQAQQRNPKALTRFVVP